MIRHLLLPLLVDGQAGCGIQYAFYVTWWMDGVCEEWIRKSQMLKEFRVPI